MEGCSADKVLLKRGRVKYSLLTSRYPNAYKLINGFDRASLMMQHMACGSAYSRRVKLSLSEGLHQRWLQF